MIKIAIKKIKIILSLGFVILSLFGNWPVYQNVPQAQAAITGVTGTASNGSTITITGSGFGTRGDYGGSQNFLNLAWSSFDTGISGGNFGLNGQNDAAWTFSNSSGRLGGWVRKRYDPAINESVRRLGGLTPNNGGSLSNTTGTYYTTFWFRPEAGAIGKFWRIYGDHGDIWINVNGDNMSGGPGTGLSGLSDVPGNPTPTSLWGSAFQFTTGGWQRVEIYMRDTAGNDYFSVYVDGVLAAQRGSTLPSHVNPWEGSTSNERQQWVYSPWGGNGHTMELGHMVDNAGWDYDDAYVDYTPARVELGNASTWAASTHREIQIPTAWSDTSITATFNAGSFTNGQTAYLYVIDGNNNPTNTTGSQVVIGSGGSTPPPPPPPPTPVVGDINNDHIVNAIDYSILNSDWFTTNARSDLNTDGLVNAIDFSILNEHWGQTW